MTGEQPNPRRRVRTGCLTCRGRRRKCDEARPVCQNCKSKALTCRYGVNFTFVNPKGQKLAKQSSSDGSSILRGESLTSNALPAVSTSHEGPGHDIVQSNATSLQPAVLQETHDDTDADTNVDNLQEDIPQQTDEDDVEEAMVWSVDNPKTSMNENQEVTTVSQLATAGSQAQQLSLWQSNEASQRVDGLAREVDVGRQEQYELELLHHYRYKIAEILDLDLGNLKFGVGVLLDATRCTLVYKSILALSSCHRFATDSSHHDLDKSMSTQTINDAYTSECTISDGEALTRSILMAMNVLICEDPHIWIEKLHQLFSQHLAQAVSHDDRPILARMALTALLMASSRENLNLMHWFLDDPLTIFAVIDANHPQHELQTSLALLAEASHFLPGVARHGKQLVEAWQSCWKRLGLWYGSRMVKMQEILNLSGASDVTPQNDQGFPLILFSNACAAAANVAYHLAAVLLLQNKPRVIKTPTRYGPPASSILHMKSLIGIANIAADSGFWDPLMTTAVVVTAKRLSHQKQRHAAANILRQISKVSGMNLKTQINEIMLLD